MKNQDHHIECSVENGVGILTLNRPEAINALTPYMIETIRQTLLDWRDDEGVRVVLFEGKGPRGFCAGGDVRWTRQMVLDGNRAQAFDFFALEYDMNRIIATYAKPIVALTHGVVMGGGLGLAGHARHRFTTQGSRFAMPEAAIGFFCDVGVRSLLAKVNRHQAMMFMLAGTLVSSADGVLLGLTDTIICDEGLAEMRAGIIAAGSAGDVEGEIGALETRFGIKREAGEFCHLADRFEKVFAPKSAEEIYENLEEEISQGSELAKTASIILSRCPTSNRVHVPALDAARQVPEITRVLEVDLRLAHILAKRADFLEGVRAVLVDKDHAPNWQPPHILDVEGKAIDAALAQANGKNK